MKYLLYIYLILIISSIPTRAQTILGAPNTILNPIVLNPALTGLRYEQEAPTYLNLSNRQQWTNIKDAPTAQILTYDKAIPDSKIGLGLIVHNEQMHIFQQYGVRFAYAYHLKWGAANEVPKSFSIGASVGFKQQRLDLARANPKDLDDMALQESIDQTNQTSLDMNIALNYRLPVEGRNSHNLGFGFGRFLPNTWNDTTRLLKNKANGLFSWRYLRYLDKDYSNLTHSLEPTVSFLYRFDKFGIEQMNLDVIWRVRVKNEVLNHFFVSAGWQTAFQKAHYLRSMFGFQLSNHYAIAYNYEKNLSGLKWMPDNIHQIQLQIALGEKRELK